ncbi:AAA family ATPase [Streptomyces sp. MUM 203J]|nr:helix-hairpin-helix domain-containing protein [Streptomyces sp. MUM 203J]MCH0539477.1 AAA family ATPase [Streptomyces sp. MUM 203J]
MGGEAGSPGREAEPGHGAASSDATDGPAEAAAEVSETEAELAAQREVRERIERRKAEKDGPIESGGKLSGVAAELLAAVRAVESGEKPHAAFSAPAAPPPAPAPAPAAQAPVAARGAVAAPAAARAPQRTGPAAPPEAVAAVRGVLSEGGAPEALAGRALAAFGEGAASVLREDPWRLLALPGVAPEQADGFARALLGPECGPGDARRAVALVGWVLQRAALQGHTALDAARLRAALAERSVPDPEEAVRQAVAEGAVLVFHDDVEDTAEGEDGEEAAPVLVGLDRYALAEESLADGLARLARGGPDPRWTAAPQSGLARAAAEHGLVAHTGGEASRAEPVALAVAAHGLGLRAAVAVHTENGRRRLPGDLPVPVATVEALLSGTGGPGRDAEGALAVDLLVVLDAPQLDVETAALLVESVPDGARLVLSGDPGVLPSAGAGRVFADLLAARLCPQVASRTPDPGPLGELVSGIGVGELNRVEAPHKEVVIVPVRDAGEAVHRTVQLVADSVPRALGVPSTQTQVITVGHGGAAGTRALNAALKERLNPGPGRFGGFDPGDRVAYAPVPGRTTLGRVASADAEGLHLDSEAGRVVVSKEEVESALRHGWALTAHQAAGMRWPAAVVVLPGDAAGALGRTWVYTAFGRAERHLSVVHGVDQALARAVALDPTQARVTRLRGLLEALTAAEGDGED